MLHQRGEGDGLRYYGREDFQLGLEDAMRSHPSNSSLSPYSQPAGLQAAKLLKKPEPQEFRKC